MKKLYIIIISLIFSINVNAQTPSFTWAKQLGGTNIENTSTNSSVVDISGNVFTAGAFSGTADFDPGAGTFNMTSLGPPDIFISKLDASGNFVWAKKIGAAGIDHVFGITLDGSGNVLTTGLFQGTVDFDPGAGTFNMIAVSGGGDLFISKLDGSGNFVWAKRMSNATGMFGFSIKADAGNNVLTTGTFYNTVDFDPGAGTFNMTSVGVTDAFISKLDAAGNFVWAKQLGGTSNDEVGQITTDASSNVFLAGYFYGTSDFDPGAGTFNMTALGVSDIFVSKLDAAGNFVWAKQMGGTATDRGIAITVDGTGNVYTTGFYIGTGDFDPGAGTYTLTGSGVHEHFISKLNSAGNFVWAKQFTGSPNQQAGYSIAVDGAGNVYSTGYFEGITDFDPGASTYTLTSAGLSDPFISKLNSAGNFIWAGQLSGTGLDYGFYLGLDANNNIYFAGEFDAATDFNAGVGVFNITTFGSSDVYITKYCQSPDQPAVVNGSTSICAGSSPVYTISTIPGATSYTWGLPGGWSGAGTSNTINPATGSSGTISVSGVNACGVGASQIIVITVNPLPTIAVNSGAICSGNSFTMVASGANTYSYSSGPIVSPISNSSYSVTGTSTAGCVSANTAVSNVVVNATPTISINSGSICSGNSFIIVPSGANTYTIQGGSAVVSPTTNTSYSVTGTSTAGCVSSSAAVSNVAVNALPTINASTTNSLMCAGESATLTANGASTYTFNPGGAGTSITVSPTVTSTYIINGADVNGCVNSSIFTQSVSLCTGLSALASAQAGIDIFPNPTQGFVTIRGVTGFVQIFNTLGSLIFSDKAENEKIEVDISNQSSGIYFIRIGNATRKIIKQ